MARAALRGRLSWQVATVAEIVEETPRVKTIVVDVPDWPGHRAGQHLDVRLTAEDGYRAELDEPSDGVEVVHTLTRRQPPGWSGLARRVDATLLGEVAWPAEHDPLAFVCGPTSFVETVASGLVELGYKPERVRRSGSEPREAGDASTRRKRDRRLDARSLRRRDDDCTGVCATCGTRGQVGEFKVCLRAPGAVVRCRSCGSVLMVFVTVREITCVDLRGLAQLEEG